MMKTGFKNGIFARRGQARMALGLALLATLGLLAGCSGTGPGVKPPEDPGMGIDEILAHRAAHPDEPYYPYHLATLHGQAERPDEARAYLDTAMTLDADYAPAIALMSRMDYEAGRYGQAAKLLEGYLARNPDAPDAMRVAMALNLQALEDFEGSAAVLATCQDQSGPVQTALTFTHLQGVDYQTTLPVARAAVNDNPNSAANHNNLGISLLYDGQPEEARVAFLRALELDPELPGPLYNLAIVENFYFFDPETSRDYFRRYQMAAGDGPALDPDDLGTTLGLPVASNDTDQMTLMPASSGGIHAP